jgi:hypothetical protein
MLRIESADIDLELELELLNAALDQHCHLTTDTYLF